MSSIGFSISLKEHNNSGLNSYSIDSIISELSEKVSNKSCKFNIN